jgi:hypothetical protein
VTTTNATKRGRPPYAEGQPRRVGVNWTIREDILEHINRLAAERGVARSEVANELLAKAIPQ